MNLLAIDTSTKNLSLAVSGNGGMVRFRNKKLEKPLSCSIMPSIQRILDVSNVSPKDLDGFVVGIGPGSFTGLRVGLAAIKGMALVLNKPIVGISSLDVLAMSIKVEDVGICVLCDARRQMVYSAIYKKGASGLKQRSEYVLGSIDKALEGIRGEMVFVGDGVAMYRKHIDQHPEIVPKFCDAQLKNPQAKFLVQLGQKRFQQKDFDDVDTLIPLYLYPDHCQVQKKK